jgi:hypothetical protein
MEPMTVGTQNHHDEELRKSRNDGSSLEGPILGGFHKLLEVFFGRDITEVLLITFARHYSYLSATRGSTRVARRAGM